MTTDAIILPPPAQAPPASLLQPATPAARRRHWQVLIIAVIAIALSFALTIREDGRVGLQSLPQYTAPPTCVSHALLGIDCPACGLTRSFIQLAHGDIRSSLHYHPLGWMIALAVLVQLPYRTIALHSNRMLTKRAARFVGVSIIAALIASWLLRMVV